MNLLKKYKKILLFLSIVGIVWFWLLLPDQLFDDPYSTVINDREGKLIGAKIARDGQWRFPQIEEVPKVFKDAIIAYEDERFYSHPGVDPISIVRAIKQNIQSGERVSGASTLTMQIARMSRKGQQRSYLQKIIESFLAFRIELAFSKDEILKIYSSHAPFGGNVVGLEAASWRYYHKAPKYLSQAEAAMLAVLPNAPSLIHISKNRNNLLEKRNWLIKKLHKKGLLSATDLELALLERIPPKPYPLPRSAPHLLEYIHASEPEKITGTTLDSDIQAMLNEVGNNHYQLNAQSDIHNLAILVLDTESGQMLGYLGNPSKTDQESAVDMIQAKRSSGSVLKPFLFAHRLDEGSLLPKALQRDVPTQISGYSPQNYNREYMGAVPADDALAMSLNVPAVLSLQDYGVDKFLERLKSQGFTTLDKDADHYGLTLVLGGAEVTLWDLTGAYASMGRVLQRFVQDNSKYSKSDWHSPSYKKVEKQESNSYSSHILNAGSIFQTLQAMREVRRPDEEGQWEVFESSNPIAWKTGTSYGHRDAWAVGTSKKYSIGVWIGNADGEGKHDLVGVKKAGPVLFDVLNRLPSTGFFDEPIDDLMPLPTCAKSGFLATSNCEAIDTIYCISQAQRAPSCPYHVKIHLDQNDLQVNSKCESPSKMNHVSWFDLDPAMAYYYQRDHPSYRPIPPYRVDCNANEGNTILDFIYPSSNTSIYLPLNIDGIKEKAIFKATHQNIEEVLYWHLDDEYLGETKEFHTMEISATTGYHVVTILDRNGNTVSRRFEVKG